MHLNWLADRRLVKRALGGDKSAADRLVMDHYPGVTRFLLHLSGHIDEAEELAQETFVRAWQRLHQFEARSSFRTWLHRIAFREFAARRRLVDFVELTDETVADGPTFVEPLVGALTIERAIAKLPDALRITFIVCHVQQLSTNEAAEVLGIPPGTVLSRLHNARERLRRQLSMAEIACVLPVDERKQRGQEGPHNYEMSKAAH